MENRRNCSAISPLFHNIFNISLTSRVQLHVHIYLLNVVVQIKFSSILQIWSVEVRISRSISDSPLEFEITRVDCIFNNEPVHDKTYIKICVTSKDSDQPVQSPRYGKGSRLSLCQPEGCWKHLQSAKTLIRPHGCADRSEFSIVAQVFL